MSKIVKIEKLDHFGRGIFFDNKICFVENALPKEEVKVSLSKDSKKYQEYHLDEVIKKSKSRITPKCPFFNKCGGCQLQHMSYENTLDFKLNKVKEILSKFKVNYPDITIEDNPSPFNYRNKIELKIKNRKVGFYQNNTNRIVEIDKCLVASSAINGVIQQLVNMDLNDCDIIIRSNYNNEILIQFKTKQELIINRDSFSNDLKIASIMINDKVIYGEDHLIMKTNNCLFKCSYDAFFQVNPYICEKIANYLIDNIPKYSIIADLYCGVGYLGILASSKAKKVYGIEIVDNAIKDAIINSKINKIDNMYYMLGDVSKIFKKINDNINYLIVDPPRSGLDSKTIETIINNNIPNIFYMSCDPNTLARDLKIFQNYYIIKSIKIFDMFSYTYHIESVCILERR